MGNTPSSATTTFTSGLNELLVNTEYLEIAKELKRRADSIHKSAGSPSHHSQKYRSLQESDARFLMDLLQDKDPEVQITTLKTISVLFAHNDTRRVMKKAQMKAIAKALLSDNEEVKKEALAVFQVFSEAESNHRSSTMGELCLLKVTGASDLLQLFALINVGITDKSPENIQNMLGALRKLIIESKNKAKIAEYGLDADEAKNLITLLNHEETSIANDAASILAYFLDANPCNQQTAHDGGASERLKALLTRPDNTEPEASLHAIASLCREHNASTRVIATPEVIQKISCALVSKDERRNRVYAATIFKELSSHTEGIECLLNEAVIGSLLTVCCPTQAELRIRQLSAQTIAKLMTKRRKKGSALLKKIDNGIAILLSLTDSFDNEELESGLEALNAIASIQSILSVLIELDAHKKLIPLLRGSSIAIKIKVLTLLNTMAKKDKNIQKETKALMTPFLNTLLAINDKNLNEKAGTLLVSLRGHLISLINELSPEESGSANCLESLKELKDIVQANDGSRRFISRNAGYLKRIGTLLLLEARK